VYTEQITQRAAIAAPINPQVLNNAYANTGKIDMELSRRAFFILLENRDCQGSSDDEET
jgi:hypothetical protein